MFLFMICVNVLVVYAAEEAIRKFTYFKIKRFICLFVIFTVSSLCSYYLLEEMQYKMHFKKEGTFFNSVVLAKVVEMEKEPVKSYRLFPHKESDVLDEEFIKKPGIKAVLVEENYKWVIKFIDTFSNQGNGIVAGTVLSALVDKGNVKWAHGDVYGSELDVDIYLSYSTTTADWTDLTAFVTNEKKQFNTDKILRCVLEHSKNEYIIATGHCHPVVPEALLQLKK